MLVSGAPKVDFRFEVLSLMELGGNLDFVVLRHNRHFARSAGFLVRKLSAGRGGQMVPITNAVFPVIRDAMRSARFVRGVQRRVHRCLKMATSAIGFVQRGNVYALLLQSFVQLKLTEEDWIRVIHGILRSMRCHIIASLEIEIVIASNESHSPHFVGINLQPIYDCCCAMVVSIIDLSMYVWERSRGCCLVGVKQSRRFVWIKLRPR